MTRVAFALLEIVAAGIGEAVGIVADVVVGIGIAAGTVVAVRVGTGPEVDRAVARGVAAATGSASVGAGARTVGVEV